jgi:Family of unknown function (DUF6216)
MNGEVAVSLDLVLKFVSPAAIVMGLIVLYISVRSGSWHMIRLRLWRFIHSEHEVKDPSIQSAIHDLTSLVAFRYITGIRVRSSALATKLIEWVKQNQEDFATIATAGSYFDCEKLKLRDQLPTKSSQTGLGVGLIVVTLAFYAIAVIGLDSRAYFYFKDSGKWFTATTSEIQSVPVPFLEDVVHFNAERCDAKTMPLGHFSPEEIKYLCGFLSSPTMASKVTNTIAMQRATSISFMVGLAGLFYMFFSLLKQAICVRDLAQRLALREQNVITPVVASHSTGSADDQPPAVSS